MPDVLVSKDVKMVTSGISSLLKDPPRVLIADDQKDVLKAMALLLKGEGFKTKSVTSPHEVLGALRKSDFDLAMVDLNYTRDTTSGREGLDLLQKIRALDADLPIVVMTAWATIDVAVECMRQGACDFVQKPWDNARVLAIVRTQAQYYRTVKRKNLLEDENRLLRGQDGVTMLAQSKAMESVLEIIDSVGPSDANVLITGENGTGKGVVAQVLHEKSARRDKPLVSVNMGGLPEGIFESELFGHVRGAFTDAKADRAGRFEMAAGGTLFLDEIANIPLAQQNKLLRLLETGEFERVGSSKTQRVDVRLISATNAVPQKEVTEGRFRQDLLYRLNTIHIHLPLLTERLEDIPLLADYFLQRHQQKYRKDFGGFSSGALETLCAYRWPGNIRELDHCIERAVLLAKGRQIQPGDLGLSATDTGPASLEDMTIEEVEKYLIKRTLLRHEGNATQAAKALGLSRSAFYRRLQRFEL